MGFLFVCFLNPFRVDTWGVDCLLNMHLKIPGENSKRLLCFWQRWTLLYAASSLQGRICFKVVSGHLATGGLRGLWTRWSRPRWPQTPVFRCRPNRFAGLLSCVVRGACSGVRLCVYLRTIHVHFSPYRRRSGRLDQDGPGEGSAARTEHRPHWKWGKIRNPTGEVYSRLVCKYKRKATFQNEKQILQDLTSDFTSQSSLGSFRLHSAISRCLIVPTELDDAFTSESKNLELWRNQATVRFVAGEMCVNTVLSLSRGSDHLEHLASSVHLMMAVNPSNVGEVTHRKCH